MKSAGLVLSEKIMACMLLDQSNLKDFEVTKINMTNKVNFVTVSVKNMGKGENVGNQHFLFFPPCFQKASFFRIVKSLAFVVKSKRTY